MSETTQEIVASWFDKNGGDNFVYPHSLDALADSINQHIAALTARVAGLEAALKELGKNSKPLIVAGQMSNLCFNFGQPSVTIGPRERELMRNIARDWDTTISEYKAQIDAALSAR